MSAQSEESPTNPLEALESLVAASRRPNERSSERAEPRLAAVSGTPVARTPKLDTRIDTKLDTSRLDSSRPVIAAGDRLESAMSEFVRRQIKPEAVPEPAGLKREGIRGMLVAGAVGLAAAASVACVVALLFVTLFPREKDPVQSFAAAAPAAIPLAQPSDESKQAASQLRALAAAEVGSDGDSTSHEQSERLLQQFVQWRQKAALTDKP
jgi:hypothetical protein